MRRLTTRLVCGLIVLASGPLAAQQRASPASDSLAKGLLAERRGNYAEAARLFSATLAENIAVARSNATAVLPWEPSSAEQSSPAGQENVDERLCRSKDQQACGGVAAE